MPKLIYIQSHPIQYKSPLFEKLNKELEDSWNFEVWYLSNHGLVENFEPDFGTRFRWDVPLLNGYNYRILKNYSLKPGIFSGFFGLMNFSILVNIFSLPNGSKIILHGYNYLSCWLAIFAVFLSFRRYELWFSGEGQLGSSELKNESSKFIKKIILNWLFNHISSRILFIGKVNYDYYLSSYKIRKTKFLLTPYSVDNDFFTWYYNLTRDFKSDIREFLKIPKSSKLVIYSGKLIDKKRPLDLIRAVKNIENANVVVHFLGDGPLKAKCEDEVRNLGLEHVFFNGFVNQSLIKLFYASADVYVMCSDSRETWGLSTNEALNFRLNLVLSDEVGCSGNFNGKFVFKYRCGDIDELTYSLTKALDYSKDLDDMLVIEKLLNEFNYSTSICNIKSSL